MDLKLTEEDELDVEYISSTQQALQQEIESGLANIHTNYQDLVQQLLQDKEHESDDFDSLMHQMTSYFKIANYLSGRVARGEERVIDSTEEILDLQKKLEEGQIHIDHMTEEMKKFEAKIENLEASLEQSEKISEEQKFKVKSFQDELAHIREENMSFKKKATKRDEVKSMSYLETMDQISSLQSEKHSKDDKIKELENNYMIKEQQVQQLIAKLDQKQFENEDLENNIELLNCDLETLQVLRDNDLDRFEQELKLKMNDIENLNMELQIQRDEVMRYMLQEQSRKTQAALNDENHHAALILSPKQTNQLQQENEPPHEDAFIPKSQNQSQDMSQSPRKISIDDNDSLNNSSNFLSQGRQNRIGSVEHNLRLQGEIIHEADLENELQDLQDVNLYLQSEKRKEMLIQTTRAQPRQRFIFNEALISTSLGKQDKMIQVNAEEEFMILQPDFDNLYDIDRDGIARASFGKKITASMITTNPERKGPEEEYFTLTVLACRMRLNEQEPELLFDCQVNNKKMFKQVQEEEVAFHNWHQWVEDQIRKMADFNKRMSSYLEKRSKQQTGFFANLKKKFMRTDKFESRYHKKLKELEKKNGKGSIVVPEPEEK